MRLALAAALLLLASTAGAATMYKCVDARGVTHYTEKPLPGCKGREVDIQPQPPTGGGAAPPPRSVGDEERDFRRRQIERERAAQKEAAEAKSRAQRCQALRAEIARLTHARRVFATDDKGERVAIDDATRARRLAELQDEAGRACR